MKLVHLRFPFYAKLALVLLVVHLIIGLLYLGSEIAMPLLIAALFAVLLRPVVVLFNKRFKLPHVLAVLAAVILFVVFIASICFLISSQVSSFTDDLPGIKHNLSLHYYHIQDWVKDRFHISYNKQEKYIQEVTLSNRGQLMESTLANFSKTLLHVLLVPIYTFLILLYRNLFKKFLAKLIDQKDHQTLVEIILEIKIVVQSYIAGLLIEMFIIALLTSIGFTFVNARYVILLGLITAVLNLIPYIGILVATIVACLINSTNLSVISGIVAVNVLVHLIDNNILVPKIVASKVKVNALISIVGVLIGALVAGIMGMFLAIPLIAILKVIFDRVDELKPWGYLMGDDLPKTYNWKKIKLSDLHAGNEETCNKEKRDGGNKAIF